MTSKMIRSQKGAEEQRDWAIQWIVEIPDITVDVCMDYFGKLPNPPAGHSRKLPSRWSFR